MAAAHLEVETKFDIGEDQDLPTFEALDAVSRVDDAIAQELEATYFDTADNALTAANVTLRSRAGGEDDGWHLKLPIANALEGRFEVRVPPGPHPQTVPQRLRSIVRLLTRDAAVEPILTMRTHRSLHRLRDAQGSLLAEVSDDRVTAQTLHTGETTPRAWREVEVELAGGDRALLERIGQLMLSHGLTHSRTSSKLRRGLGEHAPRTAAGRDGSSSSDRRRDGTAAGLVHARLAGLVASWRRLDPLVRADAPDAVHQMRVATRRLRSTLATYRPLFDRSATEPLREDLKWIADVLGDARDGEVLRQRLVRQLDEERPELVRDRVRDFLEQNLAARYDRAHQRCLDSMATDRYLALADRLAELVAAPPWRAGAADEDVDLLRQRVRHDFKRLRRAVRDAGSAQNDRDRADRLHRVRKAARRVRYANEPLLDIDGKKAKKLRRAMKRIQRVLGDHQDGTVTSKALQDLSDQATAVGINTYTLGVLDVRQEQRATEKRAQFENAWKKATRQKP